MINLYSPGLTATCAVTSLCELLAGSATVWKVSRGSQNQFGIAIGLLVALNGIAQMIYCFTTFIYPTSKSCGDGFYTYSNNKMYFYIQILV